MRRIVLAAIAAVALLLVAVLRLSATGTSEIAACDAAMAQNDWTSATAHARRAASAYFPGAPHVEQAYERLLRIARDAELRGDRDAALFAWWAVRASSIGARGFIAPHAPDRAGADRAIARLSSSGPKEREELAVLAGEPGPSPAWVLLMGLGLAACAAGTIRTLARGASPSGGLLLAAGACAWLLGLLFA